MKIYSLCMGIALMANTALAIEADGELTSGSWDPASYEVLFSNPVCPAQNFVSYRSNFISPTKISTQDGVEKLVYPPRNQVSEIVVDGQGIPTLGGGFRSAIPANVYCEFSDFSNSTTRLEESPWRKTESPLNRLQDWINSTRAGDSLFVASFSLSMDAVAKNICDAKARGVEAKVFIHKSSSPGSAYNRIRECLGEQLVEFPADKGRLAHMKSVIIEYRNDDQGLKNKVRVSFQSGNISSGTWGHHENWNFITQDRNHWFSQDHLCLRDAITNETVQNMTLLYAEIESCRRSKGIDQVRSLDKEMKSFFIPKSGGNYDDRNELKKLVQEVEKSKTVWIAAHHLTERKLIEALKSKLKNRANTGFSVKILVDNEVFWANYQAPLQIAENAKVTDSVDGRSYPNPASLTNYCKWGKTFEETKDLRCSLFAFNDYTQGPGELADAGAELKVFESNHLAKMLFHNKILIFEYAEAEDGRPGSVFTGAGNLSSAGFEKNFENYYLVKIPHVYQAFRSQYSDLFQRASYIQDLPITWDFKVKAGDLTPY